LIVRRPRPRVIMAGMVLSCAVVGVLLASWVSGP
jgi:hypothetical protein